MTTTQGETEDSRVLTKLRASRSTLASLLKASEAMERGLAGMGDRLATGLETLSVASDAVAPLQSQAMANKALHARINRAVSPALSLCRSLALAESLQRRLARLSFPPRHPGRRFGRLVRYVECVERLQTAVGAVTEGCEPAVQRLQEAVEFLNRTKATDQLRTQRLRETLGAIRALCEAEVEAMRYEGALDQALLRLQDEYEAILQQLKHKSIVVGGEASGRETRPEEEQEGSEPRALGSDLEIEVLSRISTTLAANDCLDICIDIYVKVRYRRAAKALMRLNPDYLKTYAPEEIDAMEWVSLESAITLWIQHFELAVRTVFVSEKQLCSRVLSSIMDGAIWPECLAKIADKIMAVFFRFGEGVARSSKEPQKLFKLIDMFDSMDRLRPDFTQIFDGEPGNDICVRFRELQKLLVHAASKVFWEFGLQIEGGQDGGPPPGDGAVPKVVRYAVNYLKFLASEGYAAAMGRVLQVEQVWKAGVLSRPEPDESLLRDAVSSVLDALQRNVEGKRRRYMDKVLPHVFAMNSYWYIYMRIKGSELAKLVGEETLKKKYKTAAEEAAYSYQSHAWGPLVELLARDKSMAVSLPDQGKEALGAIARGKMEAFMKGFDGNLKKHRSSYCIPDSDLREQIKGAVAQLVVPAYADFLHANSLVLQGRPFLPPDSIRGLLMQLFSGGGGGGGGSGSTGGGVGRRLVAESSEKGSGRRRELKSRFREHGGSDGGYDGRLA